MKPVQNSLSQVPRLCNQNTLKLRLESLWELEANLGYKQVNLHIHFLSDICHISGAPYLTHVRNLCGTAQVGWLLRPLPGSELKFYKFLQPTAGIR